MSSNNNGFIKLWRSIKDSDIWDLPYKDRWLFVCILLEVNWKESEEEKRFNGEWITVKPGQMLTSYKHLAEIADFENQVTSRRSSKRLAERQAIKLKTTNQGSLLTVLNWDKWQGTRKSVTSKNVKSDKQNDKQTTSKVTTHEECNKNGRSNKEIKDFNEAQKEIVKIIPKDIIEPNKLYGLSGKWLNTYEIPRTLETIREMDAKDKWATIRESGKNPIGFIVEYIKNWEEPEENEEMSASEIYEQLD